MSAGISAVRAAVLATLLTVAAACYRSPAPPRWLPMPLDAQREAFGSWIVVQAQPRTMPVAEGELIAVDGDSIHVFSDGRLVSLARASICCAELVAYQMDLSGLQLWTVLGAVSTLSHGFVLILTAPAWTIAGTVATANASYAPRVISTNPEVLRPFARFPQGLPPGLDRTGLKSKPWTMPRRQER